MSLHDIVRSEWVVEHHRLGGTPTVGSTIYKLNKRIGMCRDRGNSSEWNADQVSVFLGVGINL